MTSQEMLNQVRMVMVERIKAGVKSIYLNKWENECEDFEDERIYDLDFSEISKHQISIVVKDIYYDCFLDTIIYDEEDDVVYMREHVEDGDDREIYFDDLTTDDIAKIADAIGNK